jgi:predicted transcriptional regulator
MNGTLGRLLGMGLIAGDAQADGLLDQPIRKRLVSLIKRRPGIHASQLAREVDQPWGTVQYHLALLRRAELVNSVESGRERRFFPEDMDPSKARLLSLLHQGRRPDITRFIHDNPGARQVDICDALSVSRKTFRASVRPLVEEGLVQEQRGLHSNRYFAQDSLAGYVDQLEELAIA